MPEIENQIKSIGHLVTQAHEFVKQYITYDGTNRVEYVYTARANAKNGEPCSVVRYAYVGLTANVSFMKEYDSTWNSAWDAF